MTIPEIFEVANILSQLSTEPDFHRSVTSIKRAIGPARSNPLPPNPRLDLLKEEAEINLAIGCTLLSMGHKDPIETQILSVLYLAPLIDRFFEHCLVDHNDPEIRENRYKLLSWVDHETSRLADFKLLRSA